MTFDDWFGQAERGDELAALVEFARQEAEGNAEEAEGLLVYFALRMGWEQALRQQALPLTASGGKGRPTLH